MAVPTSGKQWYDVRKITVPLAGEVVINYTFHPDQITFVSEAVIFGSIEIYMDGAQGGASIPLYAQGPLIVPGLSDSQHIRLVNNASVAHTLRVVAQKGFPPTNIIAPTTISNPYAGISMIDATGWNVDTLTWTRVTDITFTTLGDRTAIFRKGTKLRWRQAGAGPYKYAYCILSSFALGLTTVTLTGGSDYLMTAGAITDGAYSHIENPEGFPDWFNYVPFHAGFAVQPTILAARFTVHGRVVRVVYKQDATGTSNAITFTITVPIQAATFVGQQWSGLAYYITDNSINSVGPGMILVGSAGVAFILYTNTLGAVWTNVLQKGVYGFQMCYEL